MDIYKAIQSRNSDILQSINSNFSIQKAHSHKYIATWMKNGKRYYKYQHLMGSGIPASQEIDTNPTDESVQNRQVQAAETLQHMEGELKKLKNDYDKVVNDLTWKKNDLMSIVQVDNGKPSRESYILQGQVKKLERDRTSLKENYDHVQKQYNDLKSSYGR